MISNELRISNHLPSIPSTQKPPLPLPTRTIPSLDEAPSLLNRVVVQETLPSVEELIKADRLEEAYLKVKDSKNPKDMCLAGSLLVFLGEYEKASEVLMASILADGRNLEPWFWYIQVIHFAFKSFCAKHPRKGEKSPPLSAFVVYVTQLPHSNIYPNIGVAIFYKLFGKRESFQTPRFISEEEERDLLKYATNPTDAYFIKCLCKSGDASYALPDCSLPYLFERYIFQDWMLDYIANDKPLVAYLLRRHEQDPKDSLPIIGLSLALSAHPGEGNIWLEKLQALYGDNLICETVAKLYHTSQNDYWFAALHLISAKIDITRHIVFTNHDSLGNFDVLQDQELLSTLILQAKKMTPTGLLPPIAFFEGLFLEALEDPKCIGSFLQVAEDNHDDNLRGQAYYKLGFNYHRQENLEKSKAYLLKALPLLQDQIQLADAEVLLASVHFSSGDYVTARKYAANACNHHPKHYKGFLTLSACYEALNQSNDAEKWLLKALRLAHSEPIAESQILYLLISILIENEKKVEAQEYLNRYKATSPATLDIKRLEAHYLKKFGDKKEAIKALREVVTDENRKEADVDLYLNLLIQEKEFLEIKAFITTLPELTLNKVQCSLFAAAHLNDVAWMAELGKLKGPGLDKLSLMPLARAEYHFAKNNVPLAIRFIKELLPTHPDLKLRLQEFEKALPKPPDTPSFPISLSSTPLEKDEAFKKLQREEQLRRKEAKKSKKGVEPLPQPVKKEKKAQTNHKTAAVFKSNMNAPAAAFGSSHPPSTTSKPAVIEIVRKAPIDVPCYLDPKLTSPITKPTRKLLLHAKKAFVAMCDTYKRADLNDEVRLMALLHYQFQIWEALMHVPGFTSFNALRQAIRHKSASITLADLAYHIEEMKKSPFESCLKQLLEEGQSLQTFSLSKYKEASPLTVDELWAAVKSRLALLTPIYQGLSRLVKEKGRDEIHINDLHLEGDITAALQGIHLVLGEAFSRLLDARAIPPPLSSNPLFHNIITHGNALAHEQKKTPFPLVPENDLFNLLIEGPKLLPNELAL